MLHVIIVATTLIGVLGTAAAIRQVILDAARFRSSNVNERAGVRSRRLEWEIGE